MSAGEVINVQWGGNEDAEHTGSTLRASFLLSCPAAKQGQCARVLRQGEASNCLADSYSDETKTSGWQESKVASVMAPNSNSPEERN
jgi:hypothetical protein